MMVDGQYGGNQGRRWKVDWDKTPQPVQIKLKCLRGVRDKLPGIPMYPEHCKSDHPKITFNSNKKCPFTS